MENTGPAEQPRRGRGINVGDLPPENREDRPVIAIDNLGDWYPDRIPIIRTIGALLKRHLMGPYANWSVVSKEHQQRTYCRVFCVRIVVYEVIY